MIADNVDVKYVTDRKIDGGNPTTGQSDEQKRVIRRGGFAVRKSTSVGEMRKDGRHNRAVGRSVDRSIKDGKEKMKKKYTQHSTDEEKTLLSQFVLLSYEMRLTHLTKKLPDLPSFFQNNVKWRHYRSIVNKSHLPTWRPNYYLAGNRPPVFASGSNPSPRR